MEKTELIISYFTQFFVPYLRSLNRHKYKDEKTIFRFQTKVIAELLNVYRSAFRTSQHATQRNATQRSVERFLSASRHDNLSLHHVTLGAASSTKFLIF